jgi:uncharacterized membrane protein YkvA (DUF1232 family)
VFGNLDDLVLVPLGIYLAIKLISTEVMADSRQRAKEVMAAGKTVNKIATLVIVSIWVGLAVLNGVMVYRWVRRN